jgi:peptidoglycan/LPS O-acetylase OafA/YrhL
MPLSANSRVSESHQPLINGKQLKSPAGARQPDIQGLRAVAVFGVMIFHAGIGLPGGFAGVDIFFVISGFVISEMLQREFSRNGRIDFRRFYARRFRRLVPALSVVVVFVLGMSFLLQSPESQQVTAKTALGANTATANFVIQIVTGQYFAATAESNPLLHTWSLSVEEQFYFVFPLVLVGGMLLAQRRRRPALIVVPVAILLLASVGLTAVSLWGPTFPGSSIALGFYSPVTRSWEFSFGVLLALSMPALRKWLVGAHTALILAIIGAAGVLSTFAFLNSTVSWPGPLTLVPVMGVSLLILSGQLRPNFVRRFLATPVMTAIGDRSYSLYLWHWPFIVFAALLWPDDPWILVISVVASVIPALLSFHFVEQPIRLRAPGRLRQSVVFVTVALVVPAVGAGLILSEFGLAQVGPLKHAAHIQGCTDTDFDPTRCTWQVSDAKGSVLLVGDSQADSYSDAVIQAAQGLGLNVTISSMSGCPFVLARSVAHVDEACGAWQKRMLAFATENGPLVVLIANRAAAYVHPEWNWAVAASPTGEASTTVSEATINYARALEGVVDPIVLAGNSVGILGPIPDINDRGAANSDSLLRVLTGWGPGTPEVHATYSVLKTLLEPVEDADALVHERFPQTTFYDPNPVLCPDLAVCPSQIDGTRMYLDFGHLTPEGSMLLVPGLTTTLEQALTFLPAGDLNATTLLR